VLRHELAHSLLGDLQEGRHIGLAHAPIDDRAPHGLPVLVCSDRRQALRLGGRGPRMCDGFADVVGK